MCYVPLNLENMENMSLKFAYTGTEFPTDDMVFFMSQNKEPESMDELERDNFFDRFSEELSDLSYMEMLDVLEMAKERAF